MKEPYHYFPSSPLRTALRIGVHVLVAIPWAISGGVAIEMVFAEPGKGYVAPSGRYVACEALAPRSRYKYEPRCAVFGSMETNPAGFALAVGAFGLLSGIMQINSRRWSGR